MIEDERTNRCHDMLLRLAGSAPDDLLTQCRSWLREGHLGEIGRAVAHAALVLRVPVPEPDVDLLSALLSESGADTSALAFMDVADPVRAPIHDSHPPG